MKTISILVVEDSKEVINYVFKSVFGGEFVAFEDFLSRVHLDVVYADTFEMAQALSKERFDIIFLDHNLPKSGTFADCGYDLIPEFRKYSKNGLIVGTSSLSNLSATYDLKFNKSSADSYEKLCEIVENFSNKL